MRHVVLLAVLALGCQTEAPAEPPHSKPAEPSALNKVTDVTVDDLAAAIESGDVQLVDVRTREEFNAGHVPGAMLLPLDELSLTAPPIATLSKDKPVYLICASGNRSSRAAKQFASGGWDARNVAGGTRAWVASGRAVE